MSKMGRRQWMARLAGLTVAGGASGGLRLRASAETQSPENRSLALPDFQPRSMLRVEESPVARSRFPVIDFHTHLSWLDRNASSPKAKHHAQVSDVLKVMDQKNIRIMVNLTGAYGTALEETLQYWQRPHSDRFVVFTEPWYAEFKRPDYPRFQAEQLELAAKAGAKGLKLTKALGLYLRENVTDGTLVPVDDKRFDPMWAAAGALQMPVAIHTSDPEAFFLPIDRFNERFEELNAHPDWSFHGKDFPSSRELHEARNRVIRRHPGTKFVLLHFGMSEDLALVGEWLDSFPNVFVEFGARIGELGRQPRAARGFFDRYQDRILFGTDAVPEGYETPQQIFGEELYEIYYRFLETEDEYFEYAPAEVPPQGRWQIYGLGLPDSILRKVYQENAARLLGLEVI